MAIGTLTSSTLLASGQTILYTIWKVYNMAYEKESLIDRIERCSINEDTSSLIVKVIVNLLPFIILIGTFAIIEGVI